MSLMKRLLDESRERASGDATATGLHTETCAHSAHSGLAPIFQPCSPPRLTAPYDALSSDLRQRHLSPVANASIAPDTAPKWPSAPDPPLSSVFLLRNTPKRLQLHGSRAAVGRAGRAGRPGTGDHRFGVLYPL